MYVERLMKYLKCNRGSVVTAIVEQTAGAYYVRLYSIRITSTEHIKILIAVDRKY